MNYYEPEISVFDSYIEVTAPYNDRFRQSAKRLAGVFQDGKWRFSRRDEVGIREQCELIYGYDGLTNPPRIDVSITFHNDVVADSGKSINILSRPVARTTDKPGVLIGQGIIVKSGNIERDVSNNAVIREGTELVFRDVPYSLVTGISESSDYSVNTLHPDLELLELLFFEHEQVARRWHELEEILDKYRY